MQHHGESVLEHPFIRANRLTACTTFCGSVPGGMEKIKLWTSFFGFRPGPANSLRHGALFQVQIPIRQESLFVPRPTERPDIRLHLQCSLPIDVLQMSLDAGDSVRTARDLDHHLR